MNRIARILFMPALPVLLLIFSLVETPNFAQEPPHQPSQMTLWQARRAMAAALGITSIRFSPDGFEYDAMTYKKVPYTVKINLAMAPAVEAYSKSPLFDPSQNWYVLKLTYDAKSLPKDKVISSLLGRQWSDPGSGAAAPVLCLLCSNAPYHCSADCVQKAQTFAAAFNALRAFARDTDAPLRTFTARAATWRALATKPPIPEEVRAQRMIAEDSFKANKPDEALAHYENGVLLYPTWPEGNFNAALISGDLGYYDAAIEHMQAYLELVPEAADAQAARDKILIWQTKAKEK
jgi:tetratricopeptide (TPR) repeat protein